VADLTATVGTVVIVVTAGVAIEAVLKVRPKSNWRS
jgi:hypothetical protein